MMRGYKRFAKELYNSTRWRSVAGAIYLRAGVNRLTLRHTSFIGITGSAGKTITKDIATRILERAAPTASTQQSLNTARAVGRQMLTVTPEHRYCVMEMGVNGPGSLTWPVRLVRPHIAAVTLIGRDHYQAFKSVAAIAAEKEKVITSLRSSGTAVLNADDEYVKAMAERCRARIIWVGASEGATIRLRDATSRWPEPLCVTVEHEGRLFEIRTRLHGRHLAVPVVFALGIALAAGISLDQAIPAVEEVTPAEGRMQVVRGDDGVVFVRDDRKAPYWSVMRALEFLRDATAPRKVAVIGTLSEVPGDDSQKYKVFARDARKYADLVVFVGPNAHRGARGKRNKDDTTVMGFREIRSAAAFLQDELRAGDLVLLKGSGRADHLVRIMLNRYTAVQCWLERCGRDYFCTECPRLYRKGKPDRVATAGGAVADGIHGDAALAAFVGSRPSTTTVIAGLGNPGAQHRRTVHNAGRRVLDGIAAHENAAWSETEHGLSCHVHLGCGTEVVLFKPDAPMNHSGPALARFLMHENSNPEHCIIVHDDVALTFGKVRFKADGGDGGHRGVRSVIQALGTDAVRRVRVGVGRAGERGNAYERVLDPFSMEEEAALDEITARARDVLEERCIRTRAGA